MALDIFSLDKKKYFGSVSDVELYDVFTVFRNKTGINIDEYGTTKLSIVQV